jgi:hypothetical protein
MKSAEERKRRMGPATRFGLVLLAGAALTACKREQPSSRGTDADGQSSASNPSARQAAMAAKTRFDADLRKAMSAGSAEERQKALADLANRMLGVRLDLAWQAISQLQPGSAERELLIRDYGKALAGNNPAAAIDWAKGLADEADRLNASDQVIETCAGSQTDLLVDELLRKEGALSAGFDPLAETVLGLWANKEPQKAGAWVLSLPDGSLRDKGMQGLLDTWLFKDPAAAHSWMKSLADPKQKEEMLNATARYLSFLPGPIRVMMQPSDPRDLEEMDRRILKASGYEPAAEEAEPPAEGTDTTPSPDESLPE